MVKKIIFVNSHPIQYKVPLYQQIAKHRDIEVVYCSDESIVGKRDSEFGVDIKWDIPMLEGYRSVFIKNYSWKPSIHKGFWGLINLGIIPYLLNQKKSVVEVHGWGYLTHVLTIVFGKICGHVICLKSETPLNQEFMKNRIFVRIKHFYLRILFLFVDKFLYIGSQNKAFYKYLNVKEKNLYFTPYTVDNDRFQKLSDSTSKSLTKKKLNLPEEKMVILYAGKYIAKKRPIDLLRAFKELNNKNVILLMMGEGELRNEMETFIAENHLESNVLLTGFINQSELYYYYRSADVFVMCSGAGETWGLSVNEAMNFSLPIIVSETTGCSSDLVESGDGGNGYIFQTGNITQLAGFLKSVLEDEKKRVNMGRKSLEIIKGYSNSAIIYTLNTISKAEIR